MAIENIGMTFFAYLVSKKAAMRAVHTAVFVVRVLVSTDVRSVSDHEHASLSIQLCSMYGSRCSIFNGCRLGHIYDQ